MLSLAAACGGSSSGGAPVVVKPNTVVMKNFAFTPATLRVKRGTKVTFTNEDTVPHNATGSGSGAFIKTGNLAKGQSYTITFTKRGTYSYICTIHPDMRAEVIVR